MVGVINRGGTSLEGDQKALVTQLEALSLAHAKIVPRWTYIRSLYGRQWWLLFACSTKKSDLRNELIKDLEVGSDGISRIVGGSWWEWTKGSTPLFWRWPLPIRRQVRDGVKVFVQGKLPQYRRRQRVNSDPVKLQQVKEKLVKVVERGYFKPTYVKSLINYFDVPKGASDIRMVYDGTKSQLNAAVWAPNFFLCSVDSALMWANADTWYADRDLGEMFLNYFMDEALRPYSGVDLTSLKLVNRKKHWLAWARIFMGFTPSPYIAAKLYGWTIDVILGDRRDPKNPFKWDRVSLNLPGDPSYNPTQPRVCKMDADLLASVLEAYVDDIRPMGATELRCQRASSRVAQITQYLGQQDAARKCRPPSQTPGPWCGAFMASKEDCVWVYVSQEKWEKAKTFVFEAASKIELSADGSDWSPSPLNHKWLEKGRGFLVYFSRTYPSLVPYLKGIHLTLDSWREGRDEEGWKQKKKNKFPGDDIQADISSTDDLDLSTDEDIELANFSESIHAPLEVLPVPRLQTDLYALRQFLSLEKPPWRFVRGGRAACVQYGFGDAAKSGFGTTVRVDSQKIWYRLGIWSCTEQDESSNFRELFNLVESLEARAADNLLKGLEIFFFTDNSTAESAFFKGTSSSPKLFSLVLRLRKLEMQQGCILRFVHVSGTRMIQQGTDGLSRGDTEEGVMKGADMLSFIPLHKSCLDRSTKLESWLRGFITPSKGQADIEFLTPEDWFERGHDICGGALNDDGIWIPSFSSGTFIWTPPPAAGQVAVEQLRRARLKREESTHVVVIPRLMAPEWQRQLYKVSDLYIELPFGEHWEKKEQHEPLILAFVFPFLHFRPWQLKRSGAFLGMAGYLRKMWETSSIPVRTLLSQFFTSARELEAMPQGMVWEMLHSPGRLGFSHSSP